MNIVLVHGWGLHGGLWTPLIERLEGHDPYVVDLGFLREGVKGTGEMPPGSLCIGHSFGAMWLLKHGPRPMKGFVSIAGFDCFHRHAPAGVIPAMKEGLRTDPQAQMRRFWRACGLGDEGVGGVIDPVPLIAGLDWLATWDASKERETLDAPVLALAAEDDQIVRKEMAHAVWGDGKADLRWRPAGGHALPVTEPDWCAREIKSFIDGLDA